MKYTFETLRSMTEKVMHTLKDAGLYTDEKAPIRIEWSKQQSSAIDYGKSELVFFMDGTLYFDYYKLYVLPMQLQVEEEKVYIILRHANNGGEMRYGPVTVGQLNRVFGKVTNMPFTRTHHTLGGETTKRMYPKSEVTRRIAECLAEYIVGRILYRRQHSWLHDTHNLSARIVKQGIISYGVNCVQPSTAEVSKDVWFEHEGNECSYQWLEDGASGSLVEGYLSDAKRVGINWLIANHPISQITGKETSLLPEYVEQGHVEYLRRLDTWKITFNDPKLGKLFEIE